ncbi:MAG: GGDEF domain-containing protein, partial [Thiovulaceae bacterium]|nr:GGDEF domain-containing protein [Sulfurimonadaceae bacterium]
DLDGFKTINDTLGHSIGDKLLFQVSGRLQSVLRKSDIPSRQGGDEFVIALPETNIEGASFVSKKILEDIAKPYQIGNHILNVTCSIGIAMFPYDGADLENLSIKADVSMYKAKKLGGNCFSAEIE